MVAATLCITAAAGAQTIPQPSRTDVQVRRVMSTATTANAPATRLVKDPRSGTLYYLKRTGGIYQLDPVAGSSAFVYSPATHGLNNVQGFTIGGDGTMYLVGNADVPGTRTQATVVKGVPETDGTRTWSIMARTAPYPKSRTAYDHRLNGMAVDPAGAFLYINSGSRTDHGEVQSVGGLYPGVREVGLTACILRLPTSGSDIFLRNNRGWLRNNGYLFAEGTRNTYDMAFAPNGDLIGPDNGPDRDMPDELNWLRPGRHYGFPWRIGGLDNPQQVADYDPAADLLLNPLFNAVRQGYYRNDPTFPPRPATPLIEPIASVGPHGDSFRDPASGALRDASAEGGTISSFTPHRSPLGIVFDTGRVLAAPFRGDGFMLSWTRGDPVGDGVAGPFRDPGQDLLHLDLTKTGETYRVRATRVVRAFNNPIDAEIVGNRIYVLDYGGAQDIWEVTLPRG
jgi:glucose/arabinose dehydrogenase